MSRCHRIKVYANPAHLALGEERTLNPILQALWCAEPSEDQRRAFQSRSENFVSVARPQDADLYLLCLNWNCYVDRSLASLAIQEARCARTFQKRFVVFSNGDFTANLPFTDALLFQPSGYRSRRVLGATRLHAMPSFIPDYRALYNQGRAEVHEKSPLPRVGFCGQARGTVIDVFRRRVVCFARKWTFAVGLRRWEPPPFETVLWRKRILDRLVADERVKTHFIMRRRYRAGYWEKKKDPFHSTRLELVNNIRETDYTVCMRGGGNFSVRLYETLCLGRIPVFVDTDCILPYDHITDWKKYCVWIDSGELTSISKQILDFHNALSPTEFLELQLKCRSLWEDWLSTDGFWKRFRGHFPKIPTLPLSNESAYVHTEARSPA